MDIKTYREQFSEQVAQAKSQPNRLEELFQQTQAGVAHVAALASSEPASAEDQLTAVMSMATNSASPPSERAAALHGLAGSIGKDEEGIKMTLDLLSDSSQPVVVRRGALSALKQMKFHSSLFAAKRPEYIEALHASMEDADLEFRAEIVEALILEKDADTKDRLLAGLTDPSRALVPPVKAIQLLGYDDRLDYAVFRQIAQTSTDTEVKKQAVRLLASDPDSKELLTSILQDKTEDEEVRKTSAVALQALDPSHFEEQAKSIILDDQNTEPLRAVCITALGSFSNLAGLDLQLTNRIKDLRNDQYSAPLKNAAERFNANLPR